MSELVDESNASNDEQEKKKKSLLEDKNKEELIQIVKKHWGLLQKAKGKSDELNKKCSFLEGKVENYEKNENELQNQIAYFEKEVENLKILNDTCINEKKQVVSNLEEKINILEKEKLTSFSLLSEKDERIECLSLQLDTIKKTCQCYQEELNRYQKTIEEMKGEMGVLTAARDTALKSIEDQSAETENKLKDYSSLLNECTELRNKYTICIEENCSLSNKIEELNQYVTELQLENKKLHVGITTTDAKSVSNKEVEDIKSNSYSEEVSFLIADNQNLLLELNKFKSENDELKERIQCFENSERNKLEKNNECLSSSQPDARIFKIKQELADSQNILCVIESENSKLKQEIEILQRENQNILLELDELRKNKEITEKKFEICMEEKLNLEKEIKKLSSFLKDVSDFKTGYEFALLHGAESESFDHYQVSNYSKLDVKEGNINNNLNKTYSPEFSNVFETNNYAIEGLECALLGGGSVSELFGGHEVSEHIPSLEMSPDKIDSKKVCLDEAKVIKTDDSIQTEIELLKKKIEAYAKSLKETLEERESLKLKLEQYEKEKSNNEIGYIEAYTNTESDILEKNINESNLKFKEYEDSIHELRDENSNLISKISNLESKFSDVIRDKDAALNEINSLNLKIEEYISEIQNLVNVKTKLVNSLNNTEKRNVELDEKLTKIWEGQSKYDSEVKCLVLRVLEILNQTVSFNSSEAMYPCTIDNLKLLLEKFISVFMVYCDQIKDLESTVETLENQKQEWEEKCSQVEELNKFLEEEVKALQDELENIKCDPNYYDNFRDTRCISSPSELYSIEETNETDDRIMSLEDDTLHSQENLVSDTVIEANDVELYEQSENLMLKDDSSKPSENNCDISKSYQDSFKVLEKELNLKEEEIVLLKTAISSYETKLYDSLAKNDFYRTALVHINNLNNELKTKKCSLQRDIASLKLLPIEEWNNFVCQINSSMLQINEKFELTHQKYSTLETIIKNLRLYFQSISKYFETWMVSLSKVNEDIPLQEKIAAFSKISLDQISNFFVFSDYKNEVSNVKLLLEEVKSFDLNKQKMFSQLCNHVISSEESLSILKDQLNELKNKNVEKQDITLEQDSDEGNDDNVPRSQLIEAETKFKKLKQISLKLKKELEDSKKQCNEITAEKENVTKDLLELRKEFDRTSSEQYHCIQNYQSLQTEYDKTQDELEIQKENLKKLHGDLATTLQELNSLKEKILEQDSQLLKSKEMLDDAISSKEDTEKRFVELESKLIVAESKNEEKIMKLKELEATVEKKENHIKSVLDENNNLKNQLAKLSKDESKKTLLDLEMADYERSVSELNSQLQVKDGEIAELKQKLSTEMEKVQSLQEEIKSTEALKDIEEKRAENLKEVLEQTKTELMSAKKQEADLLNNVSSLVLKLEILVQQEEKYKLQLSESSAEIQHLKEMIKSSTENHRRIVRSLESKISSQKEEILLSHKDIQDLKQDFENYKTRVHSVLRQQKSVIPLVNSTELDLKEQLEMMVDKLKAQVKDLSEKHTAVSLEHESLQEEYENLLQRYNKALEDKAKKEAEWHTKFEQINAEKNQLRIAQENLSSQHLLQNEMLVSTYKKQIKIMSDEHKRTVNELQKQLESADLEISRLQRDQQKSGTPASSICHDNSVPFDILSQERQEGEGSECTDGASTPLRQLSLSTIPTSGFMSFEKLLQTPLESGTPTSFIQCHDCERLISELNVANKKIDHLSEVLNDSESTNLRMSEQIRVLKEEVRRLERNKEREKHAENLEYLKNVFIKFSTLNPSAEKAMLIPVLTTMLKLSPDEQQQLKNIAGDGDPNDASNSGWGSYLHRWSGLA